MHSKCKRYDYYDSCLNLDLESPRSLIVVSQLFLPEVNRPAFLECMQEFNA
jgi:hypothetical protein